jgi:hypothetical protein
MKTLKELREAYSSQDYYARKAAKLNNKRLHVKYIDGERVYTYKNKRGRPGKSWRTE